MLKTIRSAKNLLLNIVEDAEIGSRTKSTIRLADNLSLSVDKAEYAEVGKGGDSSNDETVEKSSLFKKPKHT